MVKWNRIEKMKDAKVRTDILDFDTLMKSDWHKDAQGDVLAHVSLPNSENGTNVRVNALLQGLGHSWRPILDKGSKDEVDLVKMYLEAYKRCSNQEMRIMIDTIQNGQAGTVELLRNKMITSPKEQSFDGVWKQLLSKFDDARGVVYGNEDKGSRAEIQLLFGDDIVVKESPIVGDIINRAIFLNLDGGIYLAFGINRLVCTNGAVAHTRFWKDDLTQSVREDSLNRIKEYVDWFCSLPNRKVNNIRELSVVFDKFSSRVINRFWKTWSEKIDLGQLTFYEVVDNVTRYANDSLGSTRQSCLNIRYNINRLKEHRCPTCSAELAKV